MEDKDKSVLILLFTELNYTIGLPFENAFNEKCTSNRAGSPMFQHCCLQPIIARGVIFINGKNSCLEPIAVEANNDILSITRKKNLRFVSYECKQTKLPDFLS